MEKSISVFLQASSAFMFFSAGAFGGDAILLLAPAIVSGVAGVALWGRAASGVTLGRKESRPALEPAPTQVMEALSALQDEVAQLRQDREFYRELYAADGREPARSRAEVPPGPS
jgi:hypothetical protein